MSTTRNFDVYIEHDDGGKCRVARSVAALSAAHAVQIVCEEIRCNEDHFSALPAFAVSETHSIDPRGNDGLGALRSGTGHAVQCSVGLVESAFDGHVPIGVTPVFAVIEHPEHGHIAVSVAEFHALGLPEVGNWHWLG